MTGYRVTVKLEEADSNRQALALAIQALADALVAYPGLPGTAGGRVLLEPRAEPEIKPESAAARAAQAEANARWQLALTSAVDRYVAAPDDPAVCAEVEATLRIILSTRDRYPGLVIPARIGDALGLVAKLGHLDRAVAAAAEAVR